MPKQPVETAGGRLADLGQDHAAGHRSYVDQLTPGGRLWLRTKPFYAPPTEELTLCLRTFAHADRPFWHGGR